IELVIVVRPRRDPQIIARLRVSPAEIRSGQQTERGGRAWIDQALRDLIARQWRADHRSGRTDAAGARIENRRLVRREIARAESQRRNVENARGGRRTAL